MLPSNCQETLLAVVEAQVLNIDATDLNNEKTFARVATKWVAVDVLVDEMMYLLVFEIICLR